MGINYERMYEYRFRDVDQASRQAVWQEIAADIHRRMGAPARMLDPAAGRCEFINAVPAAERWAVDIVDHDEFRHPDIKLVIADILDAQAGPDEPVLPRGSRSLLRKAVVPAILSGAALTVST